MKPGGLPVRRPTYLVNMRFFIIIFTAVAIGMLTIALTNMPYGFYMLLRVVACAYFIFIALRLKHLGSSPVISAALFFAILYNPLLKIHLSRGAWEVVNVITILACVYMARMALKMTNDVVNV